MTKRLTSLMLALIMLLSLLLTSCSGSSTPKETGDNIGEDVQRKNLVLTIYAITDDKTTEEALAAVEEKISNYCVAKYKTAIDLRFYKESEYKAKLQDMYDKFALQDEEAKKAAEEEKARKKSEAAYKATLTPEERTKYEQEQRMKAKKEAEEAEKKAKEEAALIAQGKDKAVVKEVQMDILYIMDKDMYYDFVDNDKLADIKSYLNGRYKSIQDYVYPSFITAATVGTGIFGVPNNHGISTNETYMIINTALANKYQVDLNAIRSITDLSAAFEQVKAGEPNVTPIFGDFDPEGVVFYDEIDSGRALCVYTDNLRGAKFNPLAATSMSINPQTSVPLLDYFNLKRDYNTKGYLSTTNENFFLSIQELTPAQRAEWQAKGYSTVLYKGADFNTTAALENGLFAISKRCTEPERAMEILQLMTTDSTLRDMFAFGVEDVNYIRRADKDGVVTIIDDSYSMDFFKSGNALIGSVPDTMDENYVAEAKQKNLNSFMNPFLGFRYDWNKDTNEKWVKLMAAWKAYLDPLYASLSAGTVEDVKKAMTDANTAMFYNARKQFEHTSKDFMADCTIHADYKTYVSKLVTLDTLLHFEE
ncbi:MAG: hypothetical protein IKD31_00820 [Clostridia bacterium]|nr:hypothetical protein [Clostridia bacterium]